jgi:molybdate transport system ATP-binding protein
VAGTASTPRLDVDVDVRDGLTAIMGHSGAGKTTLLAAVAGLLRPAKGRAELDDTVLFDTESDVFVPPHRRRIALVFQSLALFPHLRAWENVAYGAPRHGRVDRRANALTWLRRAHVEHVAERRPGTLSGGEAQRVALARALASEPRLLLLDEPFAALDSKLRQQLGAELADLVASAGIPTLLVTHDREDAMRLSSRLLVLDGGRVSEDVPLDNHRAKVGGSP